jgi:hypothetical protein
VRLAGSHDTKGPATLPVTADYEATSRNSFRTILILLRHILFLIDRYDNVKETCA